MTRKDVTVNDAVWIIGTGGHAMEIAESVIQGGWGCLAGFVVDDETQWGDTRMGVPIVGPVTSDTMTEHNIQRAIIAIGDNAARHRIAHDLDWQITWEDVTSPTAQRSTHAVVSPGAMIGVNAIVQPGSHIGRHAIINTAAIIGHDVVVEDFGHVGPGVILTGGSHVGEGAMIGAGATVIPGVNIGAWSVIGAGACVTKDIPDRVTAVGVPAKVVRHH